MRSRGDTGEAIARRVLERAGYFVLTSNVCVQGGEVDIVARAADGVIVFVEVKLRAVEPVDHRELLPRRKLVGMRRAAARFLAEYKGRAQGVRYDLLLIIDGGVDFGATRRAVWYKGVGRGLG